MLTQIPRLSVKWVCQGGMAIALAVPFWLVQPLPTICSQFLPTVAFAQSGYPTANDHYLNDFAQLLSPKDASHIRQILSDLEAQQGIEATVVTIGSIQDYGTGDRSIESFATNLFNTWGIGDATQNNGVLVLVAVRDRNVRIEVGSGYGTQLDAAMKTVIQEFMVPSFKQNDYSAGITRGTEAIYHRLTRPETPALSPTTTTSSVPTSRFYEAPIGRGGWLIGGGLIGLGAATLGLKQYQRYRQRRCRDCGTIKVRLDEKADDQYLNAGQRKEEQIGSVNYDVWQCPDCQKHDLNRYGSLFSRYKVCNQCHFKTVQTHRTTLEPATYSSSGLEEITETCQYCSYHHRHTKVIPRKEESSSSSIRESSWSSSSASEGGDSSGGGASGDW